MDKRTSKPASPHQGKQVTECAPKQRTKQPAKAESHLEKARDMAASTLERNLVDLKDLKVIKVTKENGGWDVEVEVFEESSFIKSLGLPTRVQDSYIYEVRMDKNFEVQSYERKGLSHSTSSSKGEELY